MTTIAFDTSTSRTVAAASCGGAVAEAVLEPPGGGRPGHSAQLLAALDGLLDQAGSGWEEVDRIAVGTGPGTFTGLRIAAATAEGLRRATEATVVGVSSLEALAQPALGGDLPVASLIDARRGEVFAAGWDPAGEPLFGPVAVSPDGLVEQLAAISGRWLVAGEAPEPFGAALSQAGIAPPGDESRSAVSGRALCELAGRALPVVGPVKPAYVREPDAVRADG